MFKVAISVTGDTYNAEEAVSMAFVAIAKTIARVDDSNDKMLKAYLTTVTKTKAIDLLENLKRHFTEDIDLYEKTVAGTDSLELLIEGEEYKRLVQKILKMPRIYRDVLILRYVHGLSTGTVSAVLDLPYSTVRSRLSRGKALIAEIIKETNEYARSAN